MRQGLELLAERAVEGDQGALGELIAQIRGDVQRLASRMLGHPLDAEDASQEILLKVATHLSSFRGESALRTWVWRVACNHLLATRRSRAERASLFSVLLGQSHDDGSSITPQPTLAPDQALALDRVRTCTARGLFSLDRDHRIALLLAEIFELSSEEGAEVLEIKPAAFRKRLSRAKERLRIFLGAHCAVVGGARPCRGCVRREREGSDGDPVVQQLREMESLSDTANALRSRELGRRANVTERIRRLLSSGRYRALDS